MLYSGTSAVLANDVDDFSKVWQAMGRSRTMNETIFTIYKSGIRPEDEGEGAQDIKEPNPNPNPDPNPNPNPDPYPNPNPKQEAYMGVPALFRLAATERNS